MTTSDPGIAAEQAGGVPAVSRVDQLRDWLGVGVTLGGVSFNMLLLSAISPVLSTIAAHFGKGFGAEFIAQSIITFSGIGIILGGPLAGLLGDRIGPRRLLLLALGVYGTTGTAGLILDDATALLASRVIQGMASAGIAASTFAMVGNRFEGAARSRVLGYQGAFVAAAGTITLRIAGNLGRDISWRAPFALYLLAFVMLALALVATFHKSGGTIERRAESSRPTRALVAMWPTYLMIVPLYVAAYMFFLQLPFVLKGDGIASPVTQSNVMMAITILNFVGGLVYGRILERIGPRWMFVLILGTMAASNLTVGLSQGIVPTVVACGLAGLGGGSLVPYVMNLVLGQAPSDMRGRAIGFLYTAMYIGDFMNPALVTPLRGAIGNHAAFAVIGLMLALAAGAQAVSKRRVGAR